MNRNAVLQAFDVVRAEVDEGGVPGVAVVVLHRGETVLEAQHGWAMLTPERIPLPPTPIFDLASVTKVAATTLAVMRLYERGRGGASGPALCLDAPVADYLPEFGAAGKADVTVRHLLTHTSGLPAWRPFFQRCATCEAVWQAVCATPPEAELGSRCIYSDLEFLTLGLLVERVSGLRLDEFCRREFYEPLGLVDTGYRPPPEKWARCAATEECAWRGRVMRGEVHDENAYACGGVAGHAGLFGTAPELARLLGSILAAHPAHRLPIADCRLPIADCQSLESGVRKSQIANRKSQDSGKSQIANRKSQIGHGVRSLLRSDTVAAMLTRQPGPAHDRFALGWKWLNYADGEVSASEDAFGHDGFTGTLLWADPRRDLAVVFLSNRVHPSRDNRRIYEVRPAFVRSVIRAAD